MNKTSILSLKELSRHEITRFLIVGVFSFLIEFCIFSLLVDVLGVPYTTANYPAMGVAIIANYYLTRKHVFVSSRYSQNYTFILFSVFTLMGALLNQFLLWFFVEQIMVNIKASKFLAVGLTAVFNFLTKKYFVFTKAD
ncbi:GtrA family protein [Desertivirga brevis]|uniref:GtrA family protein n=1 Tax=Desertivirga brevis TaxID=2810310 RepID=UPI001A978E68|nr:GtrA family protein [Pedobacter sp. SYSU D00873]